MIGGLATASPQGKTTQQAGTAEGALAVGEEAYVYGYPMMVVDATKQGAFRGVANHFVYLPAPPAPSNKAVVRPNVDTLYTTGFLDLSSEPVVVHTPDTHGRYDVTQVMDANTNVIASLGKRTTGTEAHDYLFVGPRWKTPVQLVAGMTEIKSPTNTVWIINRMQLNGEGDVGAVNDLQKQFAVAPLSEWPQGAVHPTAMATDQSLPETAPDEVKKMDAPAYFNKLALLLRDNPPPAGDTALLKRFLGIGLIPGHPFNPSPDLALTLEKAKERALEKVHGRVQDLGGNVNGWTIVTKNIGTYGTDYLQRAAVTEYGLGANLPADAVYPAARVDATGEPLAGGKPYVLHFGKDQIPPVNAFWSVTLYDKDGYFVPNAMNRYAARGGELKTNPDGSVDVYLQADSPGKDREANWLPAPKDGPFNLLLRMYWPKQPVVDGTYAPPGVQLVQGR